MSDMKFSCPTCSQHIACDIAWAGHPIACPTCQNQIVVPQPPAAPRAAAGPIRVSLAPPGTSPPPPVQPSTAAAPPAPLPPAPPLSSQTGLRVAGATLDPEPSAPVDPPQPPPMPSSTSQSRAVQWAGLSGAFVVVGII